MQQTLAAMHYQRAFSSLVPSEEPARTQLLALVAGCTPLTCAAEGGHATVVQMLLENEEDVNERGMTEKEQSPIHLAALNGHVAVRLIAGGSDLEARVEPSGYTPLTLAASRGCVDIMEQLLEAGANTEARDSNNWTALFQAVFMGNPRMVKLLLDHKAKPDPLDEQQGTPLEFSRPVRSTMTPRIALVAA
ncbi:ankyrin [Aspergillus pseudonomiae]|uniref:Ankyrin n=1 Tax=Aspergillus pseudonomiae TaxID=1506151 RepID=A0A5N7D9H9_9EURO|nr:ankyrin [Aspergillus pseudonomiae]KAE8403136.1 ankyrin [Aspergillus pseudonomiae]